MPLAQSTQLAHDETGPLVGVGGWLLFFILSLILFGPGAHVIAFVRAYRENMEIFSRSAHPYSLYQFFFVEQLIGFAINAYGVFAGIQLWKKRPTAVKHAKLFIILVIAHRVAVFVMGVNWVSVMAPRGVLSKFISWKTVKPVLDALGYGAIWYSYLLKSKRVRMTYSLKTPENAPSAANPD